MSNLVLERIAEQEKQNARPKIIPQPQVFQENKPIPAAELKSELENSIKEVSEPKVESEEISFSSLFSFVAWYKKHQNEFNDGQKRPLNTLLEASDSINRICSCKREKATEQANLYFNEFWNRNKVTDLPDTILKISGAKILKIGPLIHVKKS